MDSKVEVKRKHVQYSPFVGMVFIFNLIVGTGALALPKAFSSAGWAISSAVMIIVAFLSYITATFLVETMSLANALLRIENLKKNEEPVAKVVDASQSYDDSNDDNPGLIQEQHYDDETTALIKTPQNGLFEIHEVTEMGNMAKMFFNKTGYYLFYICLAIYLFGDLAIYSVAVPVTLRDVTCTYFSNISFGNTSSNESNLCPPLLPEHPCWNNVPLTRNDVYRIYVAGFILLLGPFVYFNLQKTKHLQIFTSLLRWIAFFSMLVLSIERLAKNEGTGNPPAANPMHIPNLFGICVYSFMCHHSLPQMVTPISKKKSIHKLFASNYLVIFMFYCVLSFTGIFCFGHIFDLYTLNFQPQKCPSSTGSSDIVVTFPVLQYFLALFPVFTISTSFPIVGITLRNNLLHMFNLSKKDVRLNLKQKFVEKLLFPTVVLIIPAIIALCTSDIQLLVGLTGSYAGAFIQYIVPASLVLLARAKMSGLHLNERSPYESPFKHKAWAGIVFSWAIICFVVVTFNNIVMLST